MTTAKFYHLEYCLVLGGKTWTAHVIPIRDPSEAETERKKRDGDPLYACVRVTGPFDHEVPA